LVDYPQEGYEQIYDISFIGDLRGERREYVEAVNATHIQGAYGKDHAIAVAKSKINLNFTDGGPSDRVYKVLAAGGFLLTQPWPGIDEQFIEGVDLITFNSIETLRRESNYFLKNPKERQACAIVGKGTVKSYSREFFGSNIMFELERYELANGNKS
jgi:spore maturation protein CgeB